MKLRTKFHLASACLILIVVSGMMISLYLSEKKQLSAQIRREQSEDLAKLARVCEDSLIAADELILINYVKTLLLSRKVSYAGFLDRAGSGWIYSAQQAFVFVDPKDPLVRDVIAHHKLLMRDVEFKGAKIVELSLPVKTWGFVRLGYSKAVITSLFRESMKSTFHRLRIVGLISLAFGLVLAHFFSLALSRPIGHLMNATEEIAGGKKGIQIPEGGSDELGRLTQTFNRMSEELAKLDELKDDFMSHVTHELRSPLTSIIATVDLLAEMPIAGKDPKFKRSIDRLIYGSERLNRLVDNILDLTRMEAGKMPFDIHPVNVGALASEMVDFFEPRAMEKNLRIQARVPDHMALAMADPEKIRQVFSNLIYNAIKFTNKGGITVWVKESDGQVRIGVQDTGVGIPKDKLENLFQKFSCLKDTRDRVEKPVPGSGLGLNIVKNSIKAQGGTIWVESEVDKGSTFIFTLPVATSELNGHAVASTKENETGTDPAPQPNPRQAVIIEEKRLIV